MNETDDVLELTLGSGCPDDLRAAGLMVSCHNDYMQAEHPGGPKVRHTFWSFTLDSQRLGLIAFVGEGRTDAEALDHVRRDLAVRLGVS